VKCCSLSLYIIPFFFLPCIIPFIPYIRGLADLDHDGRLDAHEFALTMFLIRLFKSGQIRSLPSTLPASLVSRRGNVAISPSIERVSRHDDTGSAAEWFIQDSEMVKYRRAFEELDVGRKKFLSGAQAREFLVKSNLPQTVLAQIWSLADMDRDGQLNLGEFCLAMHFVFMKLRGRELPLCVPDTMIAALNSFHSTDSIHRTPSGEEISTAPTTSKIDSHDKRSDNGGVTIIPTPIIEGAPLTGNDTDPLRTQLTSEQMKLMTSRERLAAKQSESQRCQVDKAEIQREIENVTKENEDLQHKIALLMQDHQREIEQLKEQRTILNQVRTEHDTLQAEWQQKSTEFHEFQKEHEDLRTSIAELHAKSAEFRQQLSEIQEATGRLKRQIDELKVERKRSTNLNLIHEQLVRSAAEEKRKLEESLPNQSASSPTSASLVKEKPTPKASGQMSPVDLSRQSSTHKPSDQNWNSSTSDSQSPIGRRSPGSWVDDPQPILSSPSGPPRSDVQSSAPSELDTIFGHENDEVTTSNPVANNTFDEAFKQLHMAESGVSKSPSPFLVRDTPHHRQQQQQQQHTKGLSSPSLSAFESDSDVLHPPFSSSSIETPTTKPSDPHLESPFAQQIEQLEAIGFEREAIISALHKTHGKVEQAAELLLDPQIRNGNTPASPGVPNPYASSSPVIDPKNPFYQGLSSHS
jgi:hypothetical protein